MKRFYYAFMIYLAMMLMIPEIAIKLIKALKTGDVEVILIYALIFITLFPVILIAVSHDAIVFDDNADRITLFIYDNLSRYYMILGTILAICAVFFLASRA